MKTARKEGVGRREFLVMSGAAIAAASFADRFLFAQDAPAIVSGNARLAVGFVSSEGRRLRTDGVGSSSAIRAVDAKNIPSSDGSFISSRARVSVMAIYGGQAMPREKVQLVAHIRPLGASDALPFYVWTSGRGMSSPSSFTVPVDQDQRIDLSLVVNGGAVESKLVARRPDVGRLTDDRKAEMSLRDTLPLVLALGNESGSFKLRRGFYIVSLDAIASGKDPAWGSLQIRKGANLQLMDVSGVEPKPAEGNFLVLKVDYADGDVDKG